MVSFLVLFLAALWTFASYAAASAQATPTALVRQVYTPSTLTLPITISPSASGAPTSKETLTITLNPSPIAGPAFTPNPEPAVPDDTPPCASLDALVSSCTTLGAAFYTLPLSGQAQCLCNVGPWDSVAAACFDQLTVLGQYYASSMTSHGLLGLCSSYGVGPTWPASVIASTSATGTPAATATDTSIETTKSGTGSAIGNATASSTQNTTPSSTQNTAPSSTQSPIRTTATGSGSFSLAQASLLVWLLPWLLVL